MASHNELPYHDPKWEHLLPETERATRETIILPLFHQLTEEEQDYVLDVVSDAGKGHG